MEESRTGKPKTVQQMASKIRRDNLNAEVDTVVKIMKVNVNNVLEKDEKLSELDARATELKEGAAQFEEISGNLRRKAWKKNRNMMIVVGIIAFIFLLFIGFKFGLF